MTLDMGQHTFEADFSSETFDATEIFQTPSLQKKVNQWVKGNYANRLQQNRFNKEAMPHKKVLFAVAMKLTRNVNDAEDLVQETLMKAFRSFHTYQEGTYCKAWLLRIQHNVFINNYRKKKRERETVCGERRDELRYAMQDNRISAVTDHPEQRLLYQEISPEVRKALKAVPEKFRNSVILADLQDNSYQEIADQENIPLGTVMSRIYRGRQLLKKQLQDYAQKEHALIAA